MQLRLVEADEHRERRREPEAADEEHGTGADECGEHTCDGRADHAGAVERRRVEADGIRQQLLTDEFGDEGLPGRVVQSREHSEREREHVDVPQDDDVGDGQSKEDETDESQQRLCDHEQPSFVELVDEVAREREHDELRPQLQSHGEAQRRGVVVREHGQNDPVLSRALHPRSGVGDQGTSEPVPVVRLRKRPERLGHRVCQPSWNSSSPE